MFNSLVAQSFLALLVGATIGSANSLLSVMPQRKMNDATMLLRNQCHGGEMDACVTLANQFAFANEVVVNGTEARGLAKMACEFGHGLGCFTYGKIIFAEACKLGHEDACG